MGPKIDQKTDQKFEVISRSIFGVTVEFMEPTCSDFGSFWAPWIFKNHKVSLCKTHFLKFVGRRFGRQLFRPRGAPRGRTVVQDERPTRKVRAAGRTMEGFEETWTETLDRDTLEVEQRT